METSLQVKAQACHVYGHLRYCVEDEHTITAHQGLVFGAGQAKEANTFNWEEAIATCAATQINGSITADIEFEWLHSESETRIVDGSGGFKVHKAQYVGEDGTELISSSLLFKPEENSEHRFICKASLKARGNLLHTVSHQMSVASGGEAFPGLEFFEVLQNFAWCFGRKFVQNFKNFSTGVFSSNINFSSSFHETKKCKFTNTLCDQSLNTV